MNVKDFYYDLPQELIAQDPLEDRSSSRLMVLGREDGSIKHRTFCDLLEYLNPGDCLVLNNTKVIPARLIGVKEANTAVDEPETDQEQTQPQGAKIELLLLNRRGENIWETLVKPGKKAKAGTKISLSLIHI